VAIPASAIGTKLPSITTTIERGRLAFFAQAIGETNPVYSQLDAARADGHPDLPVLPTFIFGLRLEAPDPFGWISDLGIDMRYVLHGEQSFTYSSVAHAGDVVTMDATITDIYEKKGGALEFVVCNTSVTRDDGSLVATMVETLVVRHPETKAN
jgi:hypothetical protein